MVNRLAGAALFLLFGHAAVMVVLRLFWPRHRATRWMESLAPVSRTWLMPFLFVVLCASAWTLTLVGHLMQPFP